MANGQRLLTPAPLPPFAARATGEVDGCGNGHGHGYAHGYGHGYGHDYGHDYGNGYGDGHDGCRASRGLRSLDGYGR